MLLNAPPLNINAFAALQGILKVCREVLTNALMVVCTGLEDMSIFIHDDSFKIKIFLFRNVSIHRREETHFKREKDTIPVEKFNIIVVHLHSCCFRF